MKEENKIKLLKRISNKWDGFNCYIGLSNDRYIIKYVGEDLYLNQKKDKIKNLSIISLRDVLDYIINDENGSVFKKIIERLKEWLKK